MNRQLRTVIVAVLCWIGAAQISLADSDYYFDFVAIAEATSLTAGDLLIISSVEPIIDESGETIYEVEAVIIPADDDPTIICLTSEISPELGDLLEIDGVVGEDEVPGGEGGGGTSILASNQNLIEIDKSVKLKDNKQLRVAFFGSRLIDPSSFALTAMELGDPTLEAFGGSFVNPIKAVYPNLDQDGIHDALLTFDVGEMLDAGALDASTEFLEFRFEYRGFALSGRVSIDIRD